jgi:UPF0755 protein
MPMETLEAPVGEEPPIDPHKPGRFAFVMILAFLVLIGGGVFAAARYYGDCKKPGDVHSPVEFTVGDGQTGEEVVDRLADAGVIRCGGIVGRFLLRQNGHGDQILAGTYDLTTNMTMDQAIRVLTTPPAGPPTVEVTIPEGYRLTQVAERVEQDIGISGSKVLEIAESGDLSLPPYLPAGSPSAEGFLFPKTYEFAKKDLTPAAVVQRMLDQFATEAGALDLKGGAERLGYTPYEIVTVASMIEEEAKIAKDRPLIAAVIYNRLDIGMTLGIDATLLYDDPTPDGSLSSSDLEFDSPYNTRINGGLTPTPITNPGAASLRAALHPADVNYLYYVLCDADGHHKFSDNIDTFNHDVATCLG